MKKKIVGTIQMVSIENIPNKYADSIWPKLHNNGGNVLYVDKGSDFGNWLESAGFVFTKSCEHIVVFR